MAHVDGRVTLSFGVLARARGVSPAWDPSTATCTVYCHGASMPEAGGDARTPVWTTVDGTQGDCGSCHGTPPPAPHPQRTDCQECHEGSLTLAGAASPPPKHLDGHLDLSLGCASCHGDEGRAGSDLVKAAPPVGTGGETATTEVAVGAHLAHVLGGPIAGPVECTSCHEVPQDPAHSDGTVELRFAGVAVTGGLAPAFDEGARTCSNTWCHGTRLAGGTLKLPVWTTVDGTQAACGTCHGFPPAKAPHTAASTGCGVCHPGTVNGDGTVNVAGGLHVDGTVEVNDVHPAGWAAPTVHGYAANAGLDGCRACHGADLAGGVTGISCASCHGAGWQGDCTFCHGDRNRASDRPAPPVGTQGELATSEVAVGAHQRHLGGGALRGPTPCAECHATPNDLGHVNGTVELTFGPVARANGSTPSFTAQDTCAATWCHGAGLRGGSHTEPLWTKVDGSEAACGTCHGTPPPAPHPQLSQCRACHPDTMATDTTIDVAGGKHVNGTVDEVTYHPVGWSVPSAHGLAANRDLELCRSCHGSDLAGGSVGISCAACHGAGWESNCAFCHGDRNRAGSALLKAAPPQGSQDETATTARAVGAHLSHVDAGPLAGAIGCPTCHPVPTGLAHVDGTPAVTFSGVASAAAPPASWNGTTCATYCHGASLSGGTNKAPAWTTVDGTQASCGTCHGVAPPAPHPQNADCGRCHGGYTSGTVNPASHVNGTLELDALTCASCHGDAARAGTDLEKAAPPIGTAGETAQTTRAVGAHAAHVYGSRWSDGVACAECHTVPGQLLHASGTVELSFGPIANARGAVTTWNGTTCATSNCHGAGSDKQGTNETPTWTGGASQADCGTCHAVGNALRPPGSYHFTHRSLYCSGCHGDGYSDTTVNRPTHVNGVVEQKSCDALECHGLE
jgi:predicted CxxxxCH...CXXCH cytochrome family protein